jgi:hypothetical protein
VNEPRRRRARPEPAVSREVVLTLDGTEQRITWFGVGVNALVALYLLYYVVFVGHQTFTYSKKVTSSATTCPTVRGYGAGVLDHATSTCTYTHVTSLSGLLFEAGFLVVTAATMAYFNYRRKRVGVVVVAFFLFLALNSVLIGPLPIGLIFLILAVWLMLRAWRLQKYGVASTREVSKVTRERADARRSGKDAPSNSSPKSATPTASDEPRRPPEPSKRYTPKKPPPKKRR